MAMQVLRDKLLADIRAFPQKQYYIESIISEIDVNLMDLERENIETAFDYKAEFNPVSKQWSICMESGKEYFENNFKQTNNETKRNLTN